MTIETSTQDGVHIVKLTGKLGMGPALDQFNAAMHELLSQSHNKIVLDLQEMTAMDSSGIGALVRHLTTARRSGGAIKLSKPADLISQTLKMVGLLNLFPTYQDLPAAVSSFR
ncbi:MAG TPA: STAS domain-containing protein [Candidatus Methylomirabilis sp.]|nr:STAS domain-containing protein [Candidatus Methylomirabilis sp.]